MKKYISYLAITLLLAIALAACTDEDSPVTISGEEGYVTLQLKNNALTTRSTEAGEDNYNENQIATVDCFFYPNGKANEQAVFSALGIALNEKGNATVSIKIPQDKVDALFGKSGNTCQAYVIANRPSNSPLGTDTSMPTLKKIEVEAKGFASNEDPIQTSFVMDGDDNVTLSTDRKSISGTVELYRAASKISLFITKIERTLTDEAGNTWTSDPDNMKVFFHRGVKKGCIDGAYSAKTDDYFEFPLNGNTRGFEQKNAEKGYEHIPFYSYPSDWKNDTDHEAYLTLVVPWQKEGTSKWQSCYYQIPINVINQKFERNNYYKINLRVSMLGDFNPDKPVELTPSYIILDWGKGTISATMKNYQYLVVDETYKEIYNISDYSINYTSSSEITVTVEEITYPYYGNASGERTIKITSSGKSGNPPSSDKNQYRDYSVTRDESNIKFSHSIAKVTNYVPHTVKLKVVNKDGFSEYITIVQYPSIYLSCTDGGNVFVNGYFANVVNATFGERNNDGSKYSMNYNNNSKDNDIINTGYNYLDKEKGGANLNMTSTTNIYVTAFNENNNYYQIGNQKYYYRIADSRATNNFDNLHNYLIGQTKKGNSWNATTETWSDKDQIKMTSTDEAARTMIAPAYKISSAWGQLDGTVSFKDAQKRCATYQEAGYPAGRWRLPTEAEILFAVQRAAEGVIPSLFVSSGGYWAGSQRYYYDNAFYTNTSRTIYCRCVYDLWYWGEKSLSTNEYHAKETKQ